MPPLCWGIASAGLISHDFAAALSTLPAEDHQLVAIAARNERDAKRFADKFGIPKHYEGYEPLATDERVDVVYIGAINPTHFDIGMRMLDGGKHVLCEKPLCMNEKQAKRLLDHAKAKKLFCMEAIWSRFFPAYQHLKNRIEQGDLGTIQRVDAALGHAGWAGVERVRCKSLGGGTILDLGVYSIQAALWAFPGQEVTSVSTTGLLNSDGVDEEMYGELRFKDGGVAKVSCSGINSFHNSLRVEGSKGSMTLYSIWCSDRLKDVDGKSKDWPLPPTRHRFNFPNSCGLRYEAEEVRRCIEAGLLESPVVPHAESLRIAHIQDELRRQIGVEYPEDTE